MKIRYSPIFFILFNCFFYHSQDSTLRLNDIRILASHNSYKKLPDSKVIRFLSHFNKQLGAENDPIQLDYGHSLIEAQLSDYNIRGLELDIYSDPKGKLYRKRKINRFIWGQRVSAREPKLKLPGFKVLHIPDIDFESNYLTFKDALIELKKWSEEHPNHIPIFVNIEAKGSSAADESSFLRFLGFKRALSFDSIVYVNLDQEILSVFNREQLFVPANLKGNYSTIRDRIDAIGWPLLQSCLGKVIFILQGNNDNIYKRSIDRNENRVMFVYSEPNEKNAAFVIRNNSKGIEKEIAELTNKFIVRSRTDAGTIQARNMDYSDYQSVLKSKAQIISTDYYKPDYRFGTFQIKLPETTKDIPFIIRN